MKRKEAKEALRGGYTIVLEDGREYFMNSYKRVVCCNGDIDFNSMCEFCDCVDLAGAEIEDD